MSNIHPTVGRVIWYWPNVPGDPAPIDPEQPYKADVVLVHGRTAVSLDITTHAGQRYFKPSVVIEESPAPGCAMWMPYQKGQAARDDARTPQPNPPADTGRVGSGG